MRRRGETGLIGAMVMALVGCSSQAMTSSTVTLRAYDSSGHAMSWREFRSVQSNGHGSRGYNDALLDPVSLAVRRIGPLYDSDGLVTLDRPSGDTLLSLAWPSSDGYSALLLPVPAPGSYNFNLLAARAAVAELHTGLTRTGNRSPEIDAATSTALTALAAAEHADSDSTAAVAADEAYDAAVHARLLTLQLAGAARATTLRRAVTLDTVPGTEALARATDVVGNGGWVRFVLDVDTPLSAYSAPLSAAHAAGLKVLALPVDAAEMAGLSDDAFRRRWTDAVATLPAVDEWETGNEVNGNWLGPGVAARVQWATEFVHRHTGAPALVTLYWQLGEDDTAHAMFNWLAAHRGAVTSADDVGLSLYPEEHPLGPAIGRVLTTLHAALPGKPVLVSELGYWSDDLDHTWWWGDQADPTGAGRADVASFYTTALGGYGFTAGGSFWWYFEEEATPGSPLDTALRKVWS